MRRGGDESATRLAPNFADLTRPRRDRMTYPLGQKDVAEGHGHVADIVPNVRQGGFISHAQCSFKATQAHVILSGEKRVLQQLCAARAGVGLAHN